MLVEKSDYDAKITEIEIKIPSTSGLVEKMVMMLDWETLK